MKNFDEWNGKKKEIEKINVINRRYIHEREIWWCSLGVNIGIEIDGKNDLYERPVLILKKHTNRMISILPITSKVQEVFFHKQFFYNNEKQAVVLTQIRVIDARRINRKITKLSKKDYKEVLEKLCNIYKNETTLAGGISEPLGDNKLSIQDAKSVSSNTVYKLSVPYYSQYLEVKDAEWNIRSCSGSCVAMVMEFLTGKKIDILEYMQTAEREGGYDKLNGASHDYIISFFEEVGLKSWRYKNAETKDVNNDIAPLVESLENGNPVIVSINKIILEQKKFHLILLVGFEKNEAGEVTHFYYHEPEATVASVENNEAVGGAFRKCDIETFKQSYRGRAIFVKNK